MDEHLIRHVERTADQINEALHNSNQDMDQSLESARSLMGIPPSFYRDNIRVVLHIRIVDILQRLAYHSPDAGGISDVADWCLVQWLQILQHYPGDILALKGVDVGSLPWW